MKVKESQDFEEALAKVGSPLARVKLIAAGVEQLMRADMLRAEAFVNEALPLARKLQRRGEVRKGYCRLLYTHGLLNHSRGNFPEADSAFAEALKLARKLGERSHGTRARSQDKASYNARDVDRPTSQLSECGGGGDWLCCQRKPEEEDREATVDYETSATAVPVRAGMEIFRAAAREFESRFYGKAREEISEAFTDRTQDLRVAEGQSRLERNGQRALCHDSCNRNVSTPHSHETWTFPVQ